MHTGLASGCLLVSQVGEGMVKRPETHQSSITFTPSSFQESIKERLEVLSSTQGAFIRVGAVSLSGSLRFTSHYYTSASNHSHT